MQFRLIGYSLAIALFLGPVAVLANRSDEYGRVNEVPSPVHEIPEFVCDRVDLVRGLAFDRPSGTVGPNGSGPLAQKDVPAPDGRNPLCDCRTGDTAYGHSNCPSRRPVM